jgi:putative redox protein
MASTPQSPAAAPKPEAVHVEETHAGLYQVVIHAGGATFLGDEPQAAGGLGSGPNPYELLAAALGACTAMTVRSYAERKGWPLAHVSVRVAHVRATLEARDRFEREISFEGDLDAAQLARLEEIAKRCPVHRTLERGADVQTAIVPAGVAALEASSGQHVHAMNEACSEGAAA